MNSIEYIALTGVVFLVLRVNSVYNTLFFAASVKVDPTSGPKAAGH